MPIQSSLGTSLNQWINPPEIKNTGVWMNHNSITDLMGFECII